nr:transglutaminase domain-containing protein [Candidatus Krumholzibacteria bacterium]
MPCRRLIAHLVLVAVVGMLMGGAERAQAENVTGRYWYVIDNITTIDEGARFLIWATVPPDWHGQEVEVTTISPEPVAILEDIESGNRVVEWLWEPEPWERLPEMAPRHYFFHYEFSLIEKALPAAGDPDPRSEYDRTSSDYTTHTGPATWIQTDGPVRDMALEIVGQEASPRLQAKLLYDWILTQLTFVPGGEGGRDAVSTLASRRGDCGQFSNLYNALCRSLGIPARNLSLVWHDGGLHDLNEIMLPGQEWLPVDTSLGQMLLPDGGGLDPEEVASIMELRGMPVGDPDVAFGLMPSGRMILSQGVNVRFDSPTLDKQVVLQRMRPGGAQAHPAGFEARGFNRDIVHGGFHVFGDQETDDEAIHSLTHQRLAGAFFKEGLYDVVEDGCRQSLEKYAGEVESWLNVGKVHMHKGEYYKAEAAFKRAIVG